MIVGSKGLGRRRPDSARTQPLTTVYSPLCRVPATLTSRTAEGQIQTIARTGADPERVHSDNLDATKDLKVPRGDVVDRVLVTVGYFADASSLCRRLVQKLVAAGSIKSVKIGRARRIPVTELDRIVREGVTP